MRSADAPCAPRFQLPVRSLPYSLSSTQVPTPRAQIRVWDARSREMVAHMKQHMAPINDLAVLADDAHLLAACEDRRWVRVLVSACMAPKAQGWSA